ncbi:serpin family protein [Pseudobutyrivibrio xylanivorans]|uniref:Serpin B n=1 Tax=Pseudobutyrivibrio xylanivorans DSM 14809 TaxID=1123012 RepID=A0A1M6FXK1_PSEXY|nr:serpin family protein [Pseudobutyrivibrio xylanivorans]SHJ02392.1 serpin B [Pseudobutyrivibrio xylanivorans DSM 14809]
MKKRIISTLLIGMLMAGMFVGCGSSGAGGNTTPVKDPTEHKNVNTDVEVIGGMGDFDSELIKFLETKDYVNQNYMISPTSYKAALCLAIAGANGETKEELLKAAGFENEEQMNTWYSLVYNSTVDFNDWLAGDQKNVEKAKGNDDYYIDGEGTPDGAFKIVNSIWANESRGGKFRKEYIEKVEKEYDATAASLSGEKLTDAVNTWVNDSTNGQIPKLADDLTDYKLILTNALYLRAPWINEFEEYQTMKDDFKTFSGNKVTKDFMNQVDRFRYYEEDGGKLIILPLKYGVNAAFVLGEIKDIDKAIANAEVWDVDVKLPKMDIDSEFGKDIMIGYLNSRGATSAFDGSADFSEMTDDDVMIDEIIQKTKIKTDEEGLEAAAVTAIMMVESAMEQEEPEIKEFHADEPFKFIVYTELENSENEILFYGQMVE